MAANANFVTAEFTIVNDEGFQVDFRARSTTPMNMVTRAYCVKMKLNFEQTVFTYGGNQVKGEDTFQSLRMADHDVIKATKATNGDHLDVTQNE